MWLSDGLDLYTKIVVRSHIVRPWAKDPTVRYFLATLCSWVDFSDHHERKELEGDFCRAQALGLVLRAKTPLTGVRSSKQTRYSDRSNTWLVGVGGVR